MTTQQPEWKCIGHIGDVDPIAHGGAFIYTDTTGVYGPEMTWFEPGPDEDWDKEGGATKLKEYRILIEKDPEQEWWWDELSSVASFAGQTLSEMQASAKSGNLFEKAWVYDSLIHYHGADNFDSYPIELTENEAYERYADEMNMSLGRK